LVAFARRHTTSDDVLIVPPELEWFRIDAQRAVVVDEKSHPFRAAEFQQWWQRLGAIRKVYDTSEPVAVRSVWLERAAAIYGASHALLRDSDPLAAKLRPQVVAGDGDWILLGLRQHARASADHVRVGAGAQWYSASQH
jgi:hypothetical protein